MELAVATQNDRQWIYRMRHRVYADELGQHKSNATEVLTDRLEEFNLFLVVRVLPTLPCEFKRNLDPAACRVRFRQEFQART